MANYNRIKSAKAVPIGTIMPWTGSSSSSAVLDVAIPNGYVVCRGQALRAIDYPLLAQLLGNTYGPYQVAQFVIPRFIYRTLNGKSPVINGVGNQKRSYSFSSDTARATVDSLFSNKTNNVVMNIGNSNEPVTLLELANKIIQASGKKGKIKPEINKKFSNTDREADREINFRYCDTTLAKRLINYEPKISLDEGIKKVIDVGYIPLSWITSEKNYLIDE